jgi:hypothetical protein
MRGLPGRGKIWSIARPVMTSPQRNSVTRSESINDSSSDLDPADIPPSLREAGNFVTAAANGSDKTCLLWKWGKAMLMLQILHTILEMCLSSLVLRSRRPSIL